MECLRCHHENADASRFCGECGASLIRDATCAACGRSNPGGQRFCNGCGHRLADSAAPAERDPHAYTPTHLTAKILQSRAALEGERKQVSVLFADVRGSMELAERMDPEAWARIMERFFTILADGVERFEGFVEKFTGDGIMALFGAPIAHEDHAQRACYAALHLRDALRTYADELRLERAIDFAVRIGINTGEVVVGKIGDDLRMSYTAQGHTVGLAQRMEQLAAANSICLSDATARLVSGYVELRNLGAVTVKGVSHPIRAFELVGLGHHRTRLERARSRGLTRFVGREADLRALELALEQACAGDGQVVGVVAEAGVGKSRLCLEFVERCRARGIGVDQGHCPAHGRTVPYLPLLEVLRGIFGIGESDGEVEARRKIADGLLPLDPTFDELLPLVFDFLGVRDPERPAPQLSPDVRQRRLVGFLRQLVRARSAREPRVLLVDDAHWIDPGSDAFLAQVVEAIPGTRTLLVINFRPEYHAGWMGGSSYRQVPLLPLGRGATGELLADLLGGDPSLAGLEESIHERTRGNPFFIEEVVLSLVERGCLDGPKGAHRLAAPVAALEIPEGVQAVLAARIDRLPEREKRLLETASVIGREVAGRVLERVAGLPEADRAESLAALVRGEFLIEKRLHPETEFAFKHPLTHEVAYRSQLAERRAKTHAAVARALEELDAARLDERAALLAHHWEEAGDPLAAARWSVRAARWTGDTDPHGGLRHWRKARSLLARADDGRSRAHLELEACRGLLGIAAWFGGGQDEIAEEIAAAFANGCRLAESRGERQALCHLHLHYAIWHGLTRFDNAAFARHAQEAADLAELVGDAGAALAAASGLALVAYLEGRIADAISIGRRAVPSLPDDLTLGSEYWKPAPAVWLTALTRFLEGWAGRPSEGHAGLERLLRLPFETSEMAEGILRLWAVHLAELLGDAPAAIAHARREMELTRAMGGVSAIAAAGIYCVAVAHMLAGESAEAVRRFEEAVAMYEEAGGGPPIEILTMRNRLAVAYTEVGEPERAHETSLRGLELVRAFQLPVLVAQALVMHAQVLRKTQGTAAREAIEATLAEAGTLVETTAIHGWQPFLRMEKAELAALIGDETTRERELREAHRLFTDMGATGHVARVASMLGGAPR
jgi:class 3 adenylate cyclase